MRSFGAKPSASGAIRAITQTIRRLVNSTGGMPFCLAGRNVSRPAPRGDRRRFALAPAEDGVNTS
jgi:hypothetical protein